MGDNEQGDRLFRYDADFAPTGSLPLSPEVDDLEGLAVVGDRIRLTGSYSRNKSGEERPSRRYTGWFGAAGGPGEGGALDLLAGCEPCRAAALLAPEAGGLNVEGLAVLGEATWLGLRGPLSGGQAILLEVVNGGVARSITKDLGRRGVRELVSHGSGLLILAGPVADGAEPHRLYWLATPEAAPVDLGVELPPGSEGFAPDGDGLVYVIDGDGKEEPCTEPARWGRLKLTLPR